MEDRKEAQCDLGGTGSRERATCKPQLVGDEGGATRVQVEAG